jgi:hypothetical protein
VLPEVDDLTLMLLTGEDVALDMDIGPANDDECKSEENWDRKDELDEDLHAE